MWRFGDLEGLPEQKGTLAGESVSEVEVEENGLRFFFDLMGGQKTGGFLDQRENRLAARQYARGRALDCFSYAGGFALNLARQCDSVLGIDTSAGSAQPCTPQPAIERRYERAMEGSQLL